MPGTFNFSIASGLPPADYQVYSDAQFMTVWNYGALANSGKIIELCYQSMETVVIGGARTHSPALKIRSLNANCGFSVLRFTAAIHNIDFSGLNIKVQPWPKVEPSAVRFSTGVSTSLNWGGCYIFHGYGPGHTPIDPSLYYPEQSPASTGLQNSLAGAFSAGGGAGGEGTIRNCIFDSLNNADVGFKPRVVMDCIMVGIYQDIGGGRFYTDGIPTIYARNRCQRAFATSADWGGPHCDGYQQRVVGEILDGLIWVANDYFGTHGVGFQNFFLSDDTAPGGYKNVFCMSNILTGNNSNQSLIGEAGDAGGFNVTFGNTVVNLFNNGTAGTNIKSRAITARPSYIGFNLCTGSQPDAAGCGVEGDSIVTTANLNAKLPNYSNMKLATSAELLRIAAASPEGAGAMWSRQFIDMDTTDPNSVVRWNLLPPLIKYFPVTGVPVSTLTTTPIQKVKGFASTLTDLTVVPNAGVEWGTFSDEDATIPVRAFGPGTGVARRGHTYRMRATSPATAATAFTIGATINGFAVTANYTTA